MKESGAWLVPTYNGVVYLDKPAFYFKAVALSLALNGNTEAAARMPSAVFGVGLVLLVFGFCHKVHSTRCGLLAAIIVGTTPLYLVNARTVIFDIALAFFVCGAIFAGYLAEAAEGRARRGWYLLGALSAGLATLVKGPVGFLIPVLVLLVFNRVEGRRGAWKRLFAPLNLLVFLGVTLPWFVGLCLAHRTSSTMAGRGILQKVHDGEKIPPLGAVLLLSTDHRPALLPVEPAVAGGKRGNLAGALDQEFRRPALPSLVGPGDRVLLAFPIEAAGLYPQCDRGLRHPGGPLVRRRFGSPRRPRGPIGGPRDDGLCPRVPVGRAGGRGGLLLRDIFAKPLRIPAGEAARFGQAALGVAILSASFGVFGFDSPLSPRRRDGLSLSGGVPASVPAREHKGV